MEISPKKPIKKAKKEDPKKYSSSEKNPFNRIIAAILAASSVVSFTGCEPTHSVDHSPSDGNTSITTEYDETTTTNHIKDETPTNPIKTWDRSLSEVELDFINLYSKSELSAQEQKKLENLAAEIIERTAQVKKYVFDSLNESEIGKAFQELYGEEITDVKAFIHNYKSGNIAEVTFYNDNDTIFYSTHDGLVLAATILSKYCSDNVTLAEARIVASFLDSLTREEIESLLLREDRNGNMYYDTDLKSNPHLRAAIKSLLKEKTEAQIEKNEGR